jgi:hypothetical protein
MISERERSQTLATTGKPGTPSIEVNRDVDGHERRQMAYDPEDCDGPRITRTEPW